MPASSGRNELRCLCSRTPLLATYGVEPGGKLFIHVRVYKQRRIYGEIIITGGDVRLHCRECLRWHTVTIKQQNAELREDREPQHPAIEP